MPPRRASCSPYRTSPILARPAQIDAETSSARSQRRRIFDHIMTPDGRDRGRGQDHVMSCGLLAIGDAHSRGCRRTPALAQPAGTASPPAPNTALPITKEQAKAVAIAALAEAKKNNWRMAVTIVGPAGEPIYFEKMDGTQNASVEISRAKARTSIFFRRPTKVFADQFAAGNVAFMTFPDAPGGLRGRPSDHPERQDHRGDWGERRHRPAERRRGCGRRECSEIPVDGDDKSQAASGRGSKFCKNRGFLIGPGFVVSVAKLCATIRRAVAVSPG